MAELVPCIARLYNLQYFFSAYSLLKSSTCCTACGDHRVLNDHTMVAQETLRMTMILRTRVVRICVP